ncbi:MAG: YdcF family protein [Streptosporangiaceae bacterium]
MTDSEDSPETSPAPRPARTKKKTPRWRSWLGRTLFVVLAVVIATPLTVGWRVWYTARQDNRPHSDAIIVLGAAQYNGVPSPYLKFRLRHALELYHQKVAPVIVTVGGKAPGDNFTEAGTGKKYLISQGVPEAQIVSVPTGRDTLQSMVAVGEEYRRHGWKSGVIVTDPWHSLRSTKMAADNGIRAVASPTRSGPSVGTRETQFDSIVRETGGYVYYVLLGRSRGKM